MSGVAAAVSVGAAVVGAGVSMYANKQNAKTQQNSLQQQGSTSATNLDELKGLYNNYSQQTQAAYSPYQSAGNNALSQITQGLAPRETPEQYQAKLAAWEASQSQNAAALNEWQGKKYQLDAMRPDVERNKQLYAQNGGGTQFPTLKSYLDVTNPGWDMQIGDAPQVSARPEPQDPSNNLSQRQNMTPSEWMDAEAEAGRGIAEADKNWNANFNTNDYLSQFGKSEADMFANFDQAAYLASQGKSADALNQNFDMNAWLQGQGKATNALTRDFQMSDYQEDPGYQFRLAQGNRGIEASAAARGNTLSGATLKALSEYNSGQASQEYQNSVNRYNTNRNNLQGVAYNAQGQFANDRSNLIQNTNNAASQFGNDRANLINNTNNQYNKFNTDQNKLYSRYVNAYERQSAAKQTDFSNLYNINQMGMQATNQVNNANLNATNQIAQASQGNANNQMGVQAGIGNAQMAQNNANSNALMGVVGSVGSAVTNYYKNQPLTPSNPSGGYNGNSNLLSQGSYNNLNNNNFWSS
jgi:hypothetical protein